MFPITKNYTQGRVDSIISTQNPSKIKYLFVTSILPSQRGLTRADVCLVSYYHFCPYVETYLRPQFNDRKVIVKIYQLDKLRFDTHLRPMYLSDLHGDSDLLHSIRSARRDGLSHTYPVYSSSRFSAFSVRREWVYTANNSRRSLSAFAALSCAARWLSFPRG